MRHQTRSHLTNVVKIVVETGMATSEATHVSRNCSTNGFILLSAILMVIYTVLLSLWSNAGLGITPWYSLPGLMMSKVYSNSMLVLLNNRATVVNGRNAMESFEFVEVSGRGYEGNMRLRNTCQHSTASTQSQ